MPKLRADLPYPILCMLVYSSCLCKVLAVYTHCIHVCIMYLYQKWMGISTSLVILHTMDHFIRQNELGLEMTPIPTMTLGYNSGGGGGGDGDDWMLEVDLT